MPLRVRGSLQGGMEGVWGVGSPSEGVGREKEPKQRCGDRRQTGQLGSLEWGNSCFQGPPVRPWKTLPTPSTSTEPIERFVRSLPSTRDGSGIKPERMGQGMPSNSSSGTLPLWKDRHESSMVTSTLRIKSRAPFTALCPAPARTSSFFFFFLRIYLNPF